MPSLKSTQRERELQQKIEELERRLFESDETLRAIHEGEVDAIVVSGKNGEQVFSLFGAESIYRLIVETMKEAAFTLTFDGKILYCNTQFSQFLKKPTEQIIGHPLDEFVLEADKEAAFSLRIHVRNAPIKRRLVFHAADGSTVPAHISANVLKQPDEASICVVASDLTELENSTELIQQLRLQQESLRKSESLLRAVTYNSPDAIYVKDHDSRWLMANPAVLRIIGKTEKEALGKTDLELYEDPQIGQAILENDRRILDQGYPEVFEELADTPEGRRTFLSIKAPLRDAEGNIAGIVGISHDITSRKRAERQLEELNESLERRIQERTFEAEQRLLQLRQLAADLTLAEQRERQRLALLLHDGLQQTLVAAKWSLVRLEHGGNVQGAAAEISSLIDDSIETSRSLTAELSPPVLHKGGILPALEWLARWMHERHGLAVKMVSREPVQRAPEAIGVLLFQSVRELLFNVVKHAGVRTAQVEVTPMDGQIQVDVIDDGVGFDPSDLPSREDKHTGMGLFSISERLSYLGGRMEIESAPGKGSRFRLVSPYSVTSEQGSEVARGSRSEISIAMASAGEPEKSEKIRVVLVDDHIVMRQGLAGLLSTEPDIKIVGEASDGESGVKLVRKIQPDVILMDINMPGMDGIQATRIIHQEIPQVRIIGLSMFNEGEESAAIREAGAVAYLTKTGPSENLVHTIRNCMQTVLSPEIHS